MSEPICGQKAVDGALEWAKDGANCGYCDNALTDGIYLRDGYEFLREENNRLQSECEALKKERDEAKCMVNEMERVKDKAYLAAMDADGCQKAAFEMVRRAKASLDHQLRLAAQAQDRALAAESRAAQAESELRRMGARIFDLLLVIKTAFPCSCPPEARTIEPAEKRRDYLCARCATLSTTAPEKEDK